MTIDNAEPRIDYRKEAPLAIQALWTVERYTRELKVEPTLLELVKLRASMISGCAYCVDLHSKDARSWRSRATFICPERLARGALFHTTRARRAGMDRGGDRRERRPRPGRSILARSRAC
jgi:AhpD family alkylhydroperoxidase